MALAQAPPRGRPHRHRHGPARDDAGVRRARRGSARPAARRPRRGLGGHARAPRRVGAPRRHRPAAAAVLRRHRLRLAREPRRLPGAHRAALDRLPRRGHQQPAARAPQGRPGARRRAPGSRAPHDAGQQRPAALPPAEHPPVPGLAAAVRGLHHRQGPAVRARRDHGDGHRVRQSGADDRRAPSPQAPGPTRPTASSASCSPRSGCPTSTASTWPPSTVQAVVRPESVESLGLRTIGVAEDDEEDPVVVDQPPWWRRRPWLTWVLVLLAGLARRRSLGRCGPAVQPRPARVARLGHGVVGPAVRAVARGGPGQRRRRPRLRGPARGRRSARLVRARASSRGSSPSWRCRSQR